MVDTKNNYSASASVTLVPLSKTPRNLRGVFFHRTVAFLAKNLSRPPATPPGGGGGSESLMGNLETGRALERQAYSIDGSVALAPMSLKNADLQFFPTAEGFTITKKISTFINTKTI